METSRGTRNFEMSGTSRDTVWVGLPSMPTGVSGNIYIYIDYDCDYSLMVIAMINSFNHIILVLIRS